MQINKIRNEKGEISTDITEVQKILREYYEQIYANRFDNLEEMDNFLERYSPPKLNQEKIDDLNRLMTRSERESVKKNKQIPYKQKSRTRWFHRRILPNIQRRTYTNSSQNLPKIEEERTLLKTF